MVILVQHVAWKIQDPTVGCGNFLASCCTVCI